MWSSSPSCPGGASDSFTFSHLYVSASAAADAADAADGDDDNYRPWKYVTVASASVLGVLATGGILYSIHVRRRAKERTLLAPGSLVSVAATGPATRDDEMTLGDAHR